MEELGNNINVFLEQVRMLNKEVAADPMQKGPFIQQLKDLLGHYSDLRLEQYKGVINDEYYEELSEMLRSPEEVGLWKRIESATVGTLPEVETAMTLVLEYMNKYPQGPKCREVADKKNQLLTARNCFMEEDDWNRLNKANYASMHEYLQKYPETVHKKELEGMMWNCTNLLSKDELNRYLGDWTSKGGDHVSEAGKVIAGHTEWETVKSANDIFALVEFNKKYQDHPVVAEASAKLAMMKDNLLYEMQCNPSKYTESDLDKYISRGVFTKDELTDSGLIGGISDPGYPLPSLKQFAANPNYEAMPDCTDVYLFGVPGTGKTCLLMGLTGAEGNGYTINFHSKGGPYASALQQYVNAGRVPDGTPGKYVTTINCEIGEQIDKKVYMNHAINLVEMSGEEFAHKIANNDDTASLSDMGDGTMHLLRNSNRKVFLIIIDPTVDVVKFTFDEDQFDDSGNRVGTVARTEYINQSACLNKFVSIFAMEENKEFMKKVDAIHFVVTKADTLGRSEEERKQKARELLLEKYRGSIEKLIVFCRRTKRVNFATDYQPKAYPFSLGRFYVGGTFKYEDAGTLKIIDTLRHITSAKKERNFFDDLRDFLA